MPSKGKQELELAVSVPTNPLTVIGVFGAIVKFGMSVTIITLFAPVIGTVWPIRV